MKVLNVGGGPGRDLPPMFRGWKQDLLDIDPAVKPDICLDARRLSMLPAAQYDAVYCSHTLEHFYEHEIAGVLAGFLHVLKKGGFAYVAVPDLGALVTALASGTLDLNREWYKSPGGPIRFHDVLYGWSARISNGNLYYAHHCGFTKSTLCKAFQLSGFPFIYVHEDGFTLAAYAFTQQPSRDRLKQIGVD